MLGFTPLASATLGDDGLAPSGLIASQIETGAPSVDDASVSQHHSFSGVSIVTGAPIVDQLGYGNELLDADIITTRPLVDAPVISQVQALISTEITANAPVVDSTTATINIEAVASEFAAGSPTLDQSTITQSHNLQFVINISAPVVEQTRILGFAALSRVDIDGANDILLTDSKCDAAIETESVTSVLLEESYILAEVA